MNAYPLASYARPVRDALPRTAFDAAPSRLLWLLFHAGTSALGIVAVARGWGGWPCLLLWSLAIGHGFAGCAFVGHELMHGSIVRARGLRYAIGWICFLPFTLSPRLWIRWHNQVHHGNTMIEGVDPDAYPTVQTWHASKLARVADHFALAENRRWGFVSVVFGFTVQSIQLLMFWAHAQLSRRQFLFAIAESLAGAAVWTALGIALGWKIVFAYGVPLLVANAVVMGYILTNHSLSPLTEINDPLLNSLTVTVPRAFALLHLDFGLHVEHHLFPAMSPRHAPLVRAELLARWPDRYQSMPLLAALAQLAGTPRIYAAPTLLHDPRTGSEAPTLLPKEPLEEELLKAS